jgi:hypothetical protein
MRGQLPLISPIKCTGGPWGKERTFQKLGGTPEFAGAGGRMESLPEPIVQANTASHGPNKKNSERGENNSRHQPGSQA